MIEAVGIVIPVHDEATHLAGCLAAIDAAIAHLPPGVTCMAVVVLDACRDGSEVIARAWAQNAGREVLVIDERNVGLARSSGVLRVLERLLPLDEGRTWLATTDADSRVPPSWLTEQLAMAAAGAEAIAGTIVVHDWSGYPEGAGERFREFYDAHGAVVADAEAHGHVHGANLGVRADAYVAAGGFLPLVTGEDHALWRALQEHSRRRITSRRIAVTTSARQMSRAPAGFAGFLGAMLLAPR